MRYSTNRPQSAFHNVDRQSDIGPWHHKIPGQQPEQNNEINYCYAEHLENKLCNKVSILNNLANTERVHTEKKAVSEWQKYCNHLNIEAINQLPVASPSSGRQKSYYPEPLKSRKFSSSKRLSNQQNKKPLILKLQQIPADNKDTYNQRTARATVGGSLTQEGRLLYCQLLNTVIRERADYPQPKYCNAVSTEFASSLNKPLHKRSIRSFQYFSNLNVKLNRRDS